MTAKEILNGLQTQVLGRSIQCYGTVASTNDLALQFGVEGGKEGTLILAECQTAGRGRHGRQWHAPHGSSILASLILHHRLLANQIGLPNLIGAISIAVAVNALTDLPVKIKWPNDVLIHKKKVSGVLTELQYDQHRHPFFVIGFGVNVNTSLTDFPVTVRSSATSLYIESGQEFSRVALLQKILYYLEENYLQLKQGETASIIESANRLSCLSGQHVRIKTAEQFFTGTAERIDSDGGLLLSDPSGRLRKFLSGEVVQARKGNGDKGTRRQGARPEDTF